MRAESSAHVPSFKPSGDDSSDIFTKFEEINSTNIQWSPKGDSFVAKGQGSNTSVYDVPSFTKIDDLLLREARFSPRGKYIIGRNGQRLHIHDATTRKLVNKFSDQGSRILLYQISPDSKLMSVVSENLFDGSFSKPTNQGKRVYFVSFGNPMIPLTIVRIDEAGTSKSPKRVVDILRVSC